MRLFIILSSIIIITLPFSSCNETQNIPNSIVRFSELEANWNPEDGDSYTVTLQLEPEAKVESEIRIEITGINASSFVSTEPELTGNEINIPIETGSSTTSFTVFPDLNILPEGETTLNFELFYLGPGLDALPLEGRFFSLLVTVPEIEIPDEFSPPYLQDFSDCPLDGSPPGGWKEEIVLQNNLASAEWICSGGNISINAFVGGSDDTSSSEVWLLSPKINLQNSVNPSLSFDVDRRFSPEDPELEHYDIVISTDYTGDNFSQASWSRFDPGYNAMTADDPGVDGLTNTGDLDLSTFSGQTITVAFIYRAGAAGSFDATILRLTNFNVE